ncbi:MAG: family 78 glycoside hydrolase catalytic domain [Clostridia bacterium]|nr:family 78 glycoside hydrolase catalytic domain [Clostridia bacterium]
MKFSTTFISASKEYSTLRKEIPAPYFRRELTLDKIKKAELTVCGLGFYELYINGTRITKGYLSTYISNPDHYLYYDNYDLAPYLSEGKNVIGLLLGNGQLNSLGGQVWDLQKTPYRSAPKLALCFEAETEDGVKMEFDASEGFKCAPSPILFDDLRSGEHYDARRELAGWNTVSFDDSAWQTPIPADTPRGEPRLADIDPILPTREIKPVSITSDGKVSEWFTAKQRMFTDFDTEEYFHIPEDENVDGGYLYDFGITTAGIVRLHIKNAKPGQKLVMQFGEKLMDDGGLDERAMMFLPPRFDHRIIYTCKGGDEVYTPTFTYFGYRYILINGIDDSQATPELLTMIVMNTDIKKRADFSCSDETVNALWEIGLNSITSNFYHYPTDCPHREKLGWANDAASSAEHVTMIYTAERNYREWMRNIRAAMQDDGHLPGIIPTTSWGYEWGSGPISERIIVYIPYYVWLYRGDVEILKENATAILRYINYISLKRDSRGLLCMGLGDWKPAARRGGSDHQSSVEFTDTAMCIDLCRKAAKIFEVLGMNAQMAFANTIADELRTALRKYHINTSTLTSKDRCQTTQAVSIAYDIFDEAEKQAAFTQLVQLIEDDGEFIDCGMIGLRVIFHVLSDFGRTDLAYKMITRPEYPSYGNWIKNGATGMWEAFLPAEGVPDSLNHHLHSHILGWFVMHLAGINVNPRLENAAEVRFAPKFIDALDNATATVNTAGGDVTAEWHRDGEDILYTITVPAGVSAELCLEPGWQTEDGFTWRVPKGTVTFRLIRENKHDCKRLTSER